MGDETPFEPQYQTERLEYIGLQCACEKTTWTLVVLKLTPGMNERREPYSNSLTLILRALQAQE